MTLRASEQDHDDIVKARRRWRRRQIRIDPNRLIFLDESGAKTNMTRLRGRAGRGKLVNAAAPCGRWASTTMIGSIRLDGTTTCMTIAGATDTDVFRACVGGVLCPSLRKGDTVVMDKLGAHKSAATLALITALGAEMLFLPAYSPEFNPIEKMWSKVKASLCSSEARTPDELETAIAAAFEKVTPKNARCWLASFGYSFI